MINQFSSDLSSKIKLLRDLLSTKNQWMWAPSQQKAFAETKAKLSSPRILALYNPAAKTTVSADFGLGGVLSQKQPSGQWQPISYISQSLTSEEWRYAQVEKECLAVTWACKWFADLLIGKEFLIETDHKPLLPLLTSKNLDELATCALFRVTKWDWWDSSTHSLTFQVQTSKLQMLYHELCCWR